MPILTPIPQPGTSATVPAFPPASSVPTLLCTDEQIAIRSGDDYPTLAPASGRLAYGTDGALSSASPWVLTSATVDFASNGIVLGHVVLLSGGTPRVAGTGTLFAVDSSAGGTLTLRRLGLASGAGQPPGSVDATGLTFDVRTFTPQIEELTFDLYRRYSINVRVASRAPNWVYDLRDLRRLCVLETLYDRYTAALRSQQGDWSEKVKQLAGELGELRSRVSVRWGPDGTASPPVGSFSTRISR